jgi:hypothetical protein
MPSSIIKKDNKAQADIFPNKLFFWGGVLCGFLVPILLTIALMLFYGNKPYISVIANIYFLFFSNLILVSIYAQISKYVYENIGNRTIETILSGIFVVIIIIILNFVFLNNIFLGKTSSTDVFIIFIIPFYGCLSMIGGYLLAWIIRKIFRIKS